jgi:hypothetical protein
VFLLAVVAVTACGPKRQVQTVMIPPRVDLTQHEMIGVIEFDSDAEGELAEMATRRFTESARRDQGMVRMIGMGPSGRALESVHRHELDPDAFRALGQEHGVRTILVGTLTISDIKPDFSIAASLRSGSVSAQVDATLAVELIEAESGASIWSRSAKASQTVANVSVFGGKNIAFDATDPERSYGSLVDSLVQQVTRDFHVSWERR